MANMQVAIIIKINQFSKTQNTFTDPEASGGNLVTTLPIEAPGSSTNLPTSACLTLGTA